MQQVNFLLITWTMRMCACAINYWNYSFLKRESKSGKRLWWGSFLVLLLTAGCNFTKNKFCYELLPNKSSKNDYQWNITITLFAWLHRIYSEKFIRNLKNVTLYVVWYWCTDIALLLDNCHASKYLLVEISLF